jgi:hypothetical protein
MIRHAYGPVARIPSRICCRRRRRCTACNRVIRGSWRTSGASTWSCGSVVLERLIDDDGLCVVGAEYSLETGAVEFFDGVPR